MEGLVVEVTGELCLELVQEVVCDAQLVETLSEDVCRVEVGVAVQGVVVEMVGEVCR